MIQRAPGSTHSSGEYTNKQCALAKGRKLGTAEFVELHHLSPIQYSFLVGLDVSGGSSSGQDSWVCRQIPGSGNAVLSKCLTFYDLFLQSEVIKSSTFLLNSQNKNCRSFGSLRCRCTKSRICHCCTFKLRKKRASKYIYTLSRVQCSRQGCK